MASHGARWDPFREIAQLQSELSRLVGSIAGEGGGRELIPQVDVWETEREVVYASDLPGIPEDEISLELEDNLLTVTAERRRPAEVADERFQRRERRYGTFTRTIALPQSAGERDISARAENGVLEVRVRKPEEPKPKKIQIGVRRPGPDTA
jgi:HSP20 family protein